MEITFTNFSIVVLAQAHNPSILNPDFLKINGIVAPSYTPTHVVCTMPVAQVSYKEGVSIVAEFEKLQFTDTLLGRMPIESPIPEIATKYIDTLRHVKYTAVGINFTGHVSFKDRESSRLFLTSRFVKDGPWLTAGEETDIGLKFMSTFEKAKRTLSLESTEMIRTKEEKSPVILINSNYHFETEEDQLSSAKYFIAGWQTTFKDFKGFFDTIFSGVST